MRKGFTLIELMVVMVIFTAILILGYTSVKEYFFMDSKKPACSCNQY